MKSQIRKYKRKFRAWREGSVASESVLLMGEAAEGNTQDEHQVVVDLTEEDEEIEEEVN